MTINSNQIKNLRDLVDYIGSTDAKGLNRHLYKSTECGASISIKPVGGEWLHNRGNNHAWNDVREIEAFTIQSIVEGSDAEVNGPTFMLPVLTADVDAWIKNMETTVDELWAEANGDPEGQASEGAEEQWGE